MEQTLAGSPPDVGVRQVSFGIAGDDACIDRNGHDRSPFTASSAGTDPRAGGAVDVGALPFGAPRLRTTGPLAGKWQAARWPPGTGLSSGRSTRQISCASGHRGWNAHPEGGEAWLGGSPSSRVRGRVRPRPGSGIALNSALVYGCAGAGEDLLPAPGLDNATEIHDRHIIGQKAQRRQVVGDEQIGEVPFVLEVFQEVEDLGADGDVERGHRLVADDHPGIHGQRARDRNPLPLTARELVRVAVGERPRQPDPIEEDASLSDLVRAAYPGDTEGLADRVADGQPGVERIVWILEHHLHVAAKRLQSAAADVCHVGFTDADVAGFDRGDSHQTRGRSSTCPNRIHRRRPGCGRGRWSDRHLGRREQCGCRPSPSCGK